MSSSWDVKGGELALVGVCLTRWAAWSVSITHAVPCLVSFVIMFLGEGIRRGLREYLLERPVFGIDNPTHIQEFGAYEAKH